MGKWEIYSVNLVTHNERTIAYYGTELEAKLAKAHMPQDTQVIYVIEWVNQ